MFKALIALVPGIFFALVIYMMVFNTFSELVRTKVFIIFGLSIFAGMWMGAAINEIATKFRQRPRN